MMRLHWNALEWRKTAYPLRLYQPFRRSLRGTGHGHIRSSVHRTPRLVATVNIPPDVEALRVMVGACASPLRPSSALGWDTDGGAITAGLSIMRDGWFPDTIGTVFALNRCALRPSSITLSTRFVETLGGLRLSDALIGPGAPRIPGQQPQVSKV